MGAEQRGPRGAQSPALIAAAEDVELVRTLFREYADSLGVDLSFQGFAEELAALPSGYDALLVIERDGEVFGCVGVRPFEPGICEMKRLYVRPAGRGSGAGRALAVAAIERGRALGYERMRLDTLPTMRSALGLYRALGFVEIAPYYDTPIEGTVFMELAL